MVSGLTTFIVVSWNTAEMTLRCVQSIIDKEHSDHEIIVVDNHSSDDTCRLLRERYPHVRLIENESNEGYARANNKGIKAAKGDLIILMNSDAALISPEPVRQIQEYLENEPNCGIVGARQVFPDGRLQSLGREFISVKSLIKSQILFSSAPVWRSGKIPDHALAADYVDGAFLAIRRSVIDRIGLLNENYFMYAEDMEWCAAATAQGWTVRVLPKIEVLHEHAASSKKSFVNILVHNAVNQCRFLYKHYNMEKARQGFGILLVGMILRIPLSVIRRNGLARDYYLGVKKCWALLPVLSSVLSGGVFEASRH